jgi:hypothetical protein
MDEGSVNRGSGVSENSGTPRSPRRKTAINGTLETLTSRFKVAIRNVSCTGAMVEGESVPPPGKDVILNAEGMELFCSVVWSDGQRCGLHFDEPLQPAQVIELHRITPEQVRSAELKAAAEWYLSHGSYAR